MDTHVPRPGASRAVRPDSRRAVSHGVRRGWLRCALLVACGLGASLSVQAQGFPSRPLRLIVDGPPGNVNDIWARRYGQRLAESLGQSVVVDNRPGASGSIAAEAVAKAPADGYTLLFGGLNPLVAFPGAGGVVRYDPVKDFAPVAVGTMGWPLLVVNAGLGVRSFADLLQFARGRPGGLICGTAGHASVQHFACASVAQAAGIEVRTVPYKGGSPALVDAANGEVHVAVGYGTELEPYTGPGRLLPLAVFAPGRHGKFPEVPTFAELGHPSLDLPSFNGFFVPAGTPAEVIERLNGETIRAMGRSEMGEWLRTGGGVYQPMTPAEFRTLVRREQQKWRRMSEATGIRID